MKCKGNVQFHEHQISFKQLQKKGFYSYIDIFFSNADTVYQVASFFPTLCLFSLHISHFDAGQFRTLKNGGKVHVPGNPQKWEIRFCFQA